MQQVQGSARSAAFKSLSEAVQAGVPPQKAILQFVNSPEGQNFFMTDADPVSAISGFLKNAVGESYTLNPGDVRMGPDDKPVASVPTQETEAVRTFNAMAETAGLSPAETAELARAQLIKQSSGDTTSEDRALSRMVNEGKITQEFADKKRANLISIQQDRNAAGETTGYTLVDATNPQAPTATKIGGSQPTSAQPSPVDETPPPEIKGASMQTMRDLGLNPADVVEGAGIVPMFEEKAGGIIGLLPGMQAFSGERARALRGGLAQIKADMANAKDTLSKSDRSSKDDINALEGIIGNVGSTSNPIQAAQGLITWNNWLDTRERIAKEIVAKGGSDETSQKNVGNAMGELDAITKARANLPSKADLIAKMKQLQTKPTALETELPKAGGAARKLLNSTEDTVGAATGAEPAAPAAPAAPSQPKAKSPKGIALDANGKEYTFKDNAGLIKALKAGTVRAGDTVLINGVPTTLTE
jgi:hypothetical protein